MSVKSILYINFIKKLGVLFLHARTQGVRKTLKLIASKARKYPFSFAKLNIFEEYRFIDLTYQKGKQNHGDLDKFTLNWFIPPFGKGSGGHLNIVRFIGLLEKQGFKSRIIIVDSDQQNVSTTAVKEQINKWFFPVNAEVYIGLDNIPPAHTSIATGWTTAYYAKSARSSNNYVYFVQDFEPFFYPHGSNYALAEETYKFGFYGITAGNWLKNKLIKEYKMKCTSFNFSYDKDLYKLKRTKPREIKNILFYSRPPTARRGFEVGLLALRELTKMRRDVNVIFAGWDISGFKIPFKHTNAGILSLKELPDLYASCDAALVLSFTNLSLLPLELMACGVPIIANKGENSEWLLNEENSILANATPNDLASAISLVLDDKSIADRIINGGYSTAVSSDWEKEALVVGEALANLNQSQ